MNYRELGRSGINVSTVGLGTWAIGGTWWGGSNESDSLAAIDYAIDAGINLIDTAPVYGFGLAEEVIGKAIRGKDRSKIIIATKVGLVWHIEEGRPHFEMDGKRVLRNLTPSAIRYEIEQSLKRLRTDYIDLYQTHWQDPGTPISDTMGELLRLKEEGKIRAIGVSNATTKQMEKYLVCGHIDSDQPLYNMLDRSIENRNLPFCIEHCIGVLTYSSLGMGLLTGRNTPDRKFAAGDIRASEPMFAYEPVTKINDMLDQFAPFREKYCLNQTQLTIAWTSSRPGVTSALVGVRNAVQAADIAPGGDVVISAEDLEAMDRIIDGVAPL